MAITTRGEVTSSSDVAVEDTISSGEESSSSSTSSRVARRMSGANVQMEDDEEEEVESPKQGRVNSALRRAATVAAKKSSLTGQASPAFSGRQRPGKKGSGKVRRSHTMDGSPVSRSRSASRSQSPKRSLTSELTTSEEMDPSFKTTHKGSERFKRQGSSEGRASPAGLTSSATTSATKKNSTPSLLDDSDDSNEAYDQHSSLVAGTITPMHTLSPSAQRAAAFLGSPHTQTSTRSTTSEDISDDDYYASLMAPPKKYLQDFAIGSTRTTGEAPPPPATTGLDRVVSVNLMETSSSTLNIPGRKSSSQQQKPQDKPGFFSKLIGKNSTPDTSPQLGSTTLAGFGKKYQVDQSINLMDMENAARQHSRQRQQQQQQQDAARPSLFNKMLEEGSARSHRSSFEEHQRKRRTFDQKPSNSFHCNCGWAVAVLLMALTGAIALISSLVYDGSTKSIQPAPSPLTTNTTLEPTQAPKENNVPITTQGTDTTALSAEENMSAPTTLIEEQDNTTEAQAEDAKEHLSEAAREQWDNLVGLITRNNLTAKEAFENPNSSAYKALDWMIEYGAAMDFVSSDDTSHLLEKYALMVFYFATHPKAKPQESQSLIWSPPQTITKSAASFDSNKEWIHHASYPVCHWDGVHCGHLKRVVILNLTRHELQGMLPDELSALEHLVDLDLSHNHIGGTLPAIYGQMDHLRLINMRDNLLEGAFPDEWAGLPNLETLDLSENPDLKDVPDL